MVKVKTCLGWAWVFGWAALVFGFIAGDPALLAYAWFIIPIGGLAWLMLHATIQAHYDGGNNR